MARPNGMCVYCGTFGPLSMDHIPPKNLFGGNALPNLITVPCCRSCNSAASKDDQYLLVFLALREEAKLQPEHGNLWRKCLRTLKRAEALKFRQAVVGKVRRVQPMTPSGVVLPKQALLMPVDGLRVSNTIVRIIKGLYFHERAQRLPSTHLVIAHDVLALQQPPPIGRHAEILFLRTLVSRFQAMPATRLGKIFSYRWDSDPANPANTMWLLDFFDGIQFLCITRPSGGNLLTD